MKNAYRLDKPKPPRNPLRWPDYQPLQTVKLSKTPSSTAANRLQQPIEAGLVTVAADTRKLGPVYGPYTLGGRVDIVRQVGANLYVRALFCVGEVEQISSITINGASYLTGDPTSDPDYLGDWTLAATWSALGLPYAASVGDIFLYGTTYYECVAACSITAYAVPDTPVGTYAGYFAPMLTDVSVNTYTGTTTQGVDPLLAAAGGDLAGYAETLTGSWFGTSYGLAYAVICLPVASYSGGFPRVTASINGMKIYDPRTATTAYSTNPALALADFLTSPLYGLGATVDWDSVDAAADYCDEVFSDGARIQIGYAVAPDRPDRTVDWVDVLRGYALCWLDYQAGEYSLVLDAPRDTDGAIAFDQSGGTGPELMDLPTLASVPIDARPNRVRIYYTSGQATDYVTAETAAVTAETEEPRELELRMPGLFSEEMAQRYADYRLAMALGELWTAGFRLADAGALVRPGQVYTLTAPNGPAGEKIRILSVSSARLGDYQVTARAYDETVYPTP